MKKIETVGELINHLEKLPIDTKVNLWLHGKQLSLAQLYFNFDTNELVLSDMDVFETSPIEIKIDNKHVRVDGRTFEFSLKGNLDSQNRTEK